MLAITLSVMHMTSRFLGPATRHSSGNLLSSLLQTEALSTSLSIFGNNTPKRWVATAAVPHNGIWSYATIKMMICKFCLLLPYNDNVYCKSQEFSLSYALSYECDPGFWYLAFPRLFQRELFPISPYNTFSSISSLSLTHRSAHILSQKKKVLISRNDLKNLSVCVL